MLLARKIGIMNHQTANINLSKKVSTILVTTVYFCTNQRCKKINWTKNKSKNYFQPQIALNVHNVPLQ